MNIMKMQQSARILDRLIKEAGKMGNMTMSVRVTELQLFNEVTNELWTELNRTRTQKTKLEEQQAKIKAALAGEEPESLVEPIL